MTCKDVQGLLELSVLDGLSLDQERAVNEHVRGCESCRERRRNLKLLLMNVRQACPAGPLNYGLVRRITHDAEQTCIPLRRQRRLRMIGGGVSWAAAVVLVLVSVGRMLPGLFPFDSRAYAVTALEVKPVWECEAMHSVPGGRADDIIVDESRTYMVRHETVVALGSEDGQVKWETDLHTQGYLVADEKRLYCLGRDDYGRHELTALDRQTGQVLWRYRSGESVTRAFHKPVVMDERRVCWIVHPVVVLLDTRKGEVIWESRFIGDRELSQPVRIKDQCYVADGTTLHSLALDDGQVRRRDVLANRGCPNSRPEILRAGEVLLVNVTLKDGRNELICRDSVSHVDRWRKPIERVSHIMARNEQVFVRGRAIESLDLNTGRRLWSHAAQGCGPLSCSEGRLCYVDTSDEGRVISLDERTGRKCWEIPGLRSCHAFIQKGRHGYLKTQSGTLIAINLNFSGRGV